MELEPLPAVILAIAEQRSLAAVLKTIIDSVARQPGVALARLWLREPDELCPTCSSGELHPEMSLHLRASAGAPISAATDWTRTDGTFHRIPLTPGNLKIGHIATTGESIRIACLEEDHRWVRYPDWVRQERLASFAGHALVFRGEPLGVLAVFRRTTADDDCFNWLRTMASAAAVAIANARAFEDNESLRHELELERDYLREEVESSGAFGEILGSSPALQRLLHQVEMVAATDANVLVLGESGRARNSSPARSTNGALAPANRWSRSIADPFPASSSKANSSAMCAGLSPVLCVTAWGASNLPTAGPYSWMKWERYHSSCSPSSCEFCRRASSSAWAMKRREE